MRPSAPWMHRLVAILSLVVAGPAAAQGVGAITGQVVDSLSGAPLRGVTVTTGTARVTTNAAGRFTLAALTAGPHEVRIALPGFRPHTAAVEVRAGETTILSVTLGRAPTLLAESRADATLPERSAFELKPNVSAVTLSARAMDAVPRLGEADPVRVVQLLPGVLAKNDFSSSFNVRGGESDQNLILLDGYPIYNPFHLGGVFSTFIDAAVSGVELHTGGLPANAGGRLSSLLDVRSASDPRPEVHGRAELSVLAAMGALSGTVGSTGLSWNLAARRTYADQVASLVSDATVPYHFGDLQGHATWKLPARTTLALTYYQGEDVFDGTFAEITGGLEDGGDAGAFYYAWGNQVGGATLTRTMDGGLPRFTAMRGDSARFEQRASWSQFHARRDLGEGTSVATSALTDLRLAGSLTSWSARHERTLGYEIARYDVAFGVEEGQGSVDTRSARERPGSAALFAVDEWRVKSSLLLTGGLRFESYGAAAWRGLSPRVALKYFTSPDAAVTLAAGRSAQWMHSLTREDDALRSFHAWRASGPAAPVSTAWQFVLGHERWLGASRLLRIESFYKRYSRLLEADVAANASLGSDSLVPMDGRSWGADLLLRQLEAGPFSGWIAYTYAVSLRMRDSVRYAPSQDRRHDVNVVASWKFGPYVAGARLGYGSAMPYTEYVGVIPRRQWDPVSGLWGGGESRARYEGIGGARNESRLPPTRRLDLYLERHFELRRSTLTTYLSVVNATNANNVLYYSYDFTTAPGRRQGVSQLPILPAMGFSLAF